MYKLFLAILFFSAMRFCNYATAQTTDKLSAKDFLEYEDYNRALVEYLKLYKENKNDLDVNIKVGFCYLKVNDDKTKAIPYLEFVYKKGTYSDELIMYLGIAYMYAYKFDEAIKYFNIYRTKVKTKNYELVDRYIENCESAKVLIKKPVNVSFENLGKTINTKFPEYYPFITRDQSTLYFTSSRETNAKKIQSSEGFYTADIYFSTVKRGDWSKSKSISTIVNTAEDEQCVYITPDGQTMIIYIDNEQVHGDIFSTSLSPKVKSFPVPITFEDPINTNSLELEGCISEDGNTMFVSSNREGSLGETDLFKFKKLPNGKWGLPINLGSNVNTKYKETFPVYDEKNKILYFASKGHTNMGGFDIFKSKFDETTQTFGQAINMGFPINTPEDNVGFMLAENKRDGYMAAVRKEGFGDLDIYKITFNDVDVRPSVIKGIVTTNDTSKKEIDAFISLTDANTKAEIDSKNINPTSGKFIFAVGPGKYTLTLSSVGYEAVKEEITVFDKIDYIFEIEKNITLIKTATPTTLPTDETIIKADGSAMPIKIK
jgi:hypothetical protein